MSDHLQLLAYKNLQIVATDPSQKPMHVSEVRVSLIYSRFAAVHASASDRLEKKENVEVAFSWNVIDVFQAARSLIFAVPF